MLTEKRVVLKSETFDHQIHDIELFDKLAHDFKETCLKKSDFLCKRGEKSEFVYVLLSGEI